MQNDAIVRTLSNFQCRKIPEEKPVRLRNRFFQAAKVSVPRKEFLARQAFFRPKTSMNVRGLLIEQMSNFHTSENFS